VSCQMSVQVYRCRVNGVSRCVFDLPQRTVSFAVARVLGCRGMTLFFGKRREVDRVSVANGGQPLGECRDVEIGVRCGGDFGCRPVSRFSLVWVLAVKSPWARVYRSLPSGLRDRGSRVGGGCGWLTRIQLGISFGWLLVP